MPNEMLTEFESHFRQQLVGGEIEEFGLVIADLVDVEVRESGLL
jgi:hypothetical protein